MCQHKRHGDGSAKKLSTGKKVTSERPKKFASGLVFGLGDFFPGSVLEELGVDFVGWKLDVADDGASDEAALDREHVRILLGVGDADVGQLQECEKLLALSYIFSQKVF